MYFALNAIKGVDLHELVLSGGALQRAPADAEAGSAASDPTLLAAAGSKRLLELVHNQLAHKLEALDRGALPTLASVYARHAYQPAVHVHASRAVKAIVFNCTEAKEKVAGTPVIAGLIASLRQALDTLEVLDGGDAPSAPSGTREKLLRVNPWHAVAAADEAMVAMSALANKHEGNTAALTSAGAPAEAARAQALLKRLAWPPANGVAAPAGVATTPAEAGKKALMLTMILS